MAEPKTFHAASWPRERFYLSCDQRRSATVAPHSWTSDEPVAVFERWQTRKVTHHGFKVELLENAVGWRTRSECTVLELIEACRIARAWVRQEGQVA